MTSSLKKRAIQPPYERFDGGGEADVRIKEFSFVRTKEGVSAWTLKATQAELFERRQKTFLENITAKIPYGDGHYLRIEGDSGEVDSEKDDFALWKKNGQIAIELENNYVVKTSGVRWDESQRTILSQGPVRISGPQTEIEGNAFKILVDNQEMVVVGDVKALVN
ncbi:MAG: LPS export ABC transporter periplasmic protein LptC [Waddliaceae bacterium]